MAFLEGIVLAGGLGTRLRTVLPDVPKCLAPIAGEPFLSYLFTYLARQGLRRLILALGYKADTIQTWVQNRSWPFEVQFAIETASLGTGGAIQNAWPFTTTPHVLVVNGDTFCPASLPDFYQAHLQKKADISLISVPVSPAHRYGMLNISSEGWVQTFEEKQPRPIGWINAGLYLLSRTWWEKQSFPTTFSWEAYLQNALLSPQPPRIYAHQLPDTPFIDIGIPEDYERAQTYLPAHF